MKGRSKKNLDVPLSLKNFVKAVSTDQTVNQFRNCPQMVIEIKACEATLRL